tara:strand:- start:1427 stop:1669 length:243 start_codon:yes stop_codon:yes gene_type:complete
MTRTTEQKAQDYTAMGHSVDLINAVIAGSQMQEYTTSERQSCVDRNVEHLELMKAKTDWGSEDMAATTKAISDGKAYKAS